MKPPMKAPYIPEWLDDEGCECTWQGMRNKEGQWWTQMICGYCPVHGIKSTEWKNTGYTSGVEVSYDD